MTRDANWAIQVYLDGVAETDANAPPDAICTTAPAFRDSVWIGADPGSREYFHGSIDDVRIYSGTLTENEIAALATNSP